MKRTTMIAGWRRSIPALLCLVACWSLVFASGCSSSVTTAEPTSPTVETVVAGETSESIGSDANEQTNAAGVAASQPAAATGLPRLVDLGSKKCIPCIMMKPILDDLMENYADSFQTEFIDVWDHPDEGDKYGIETIPTQIFYDASGKERFRHEGFMSKDDILANWKKLGVEVEN